MRRSLALLVPALLLAAACTQSPTDATRQPTARFDGGNYFGSGNAVGGGNYHGSGNAVGSGSVGGGASTDSGTPSNADGGIFYGSGNVTSSGANTAVADSATTTDERGVNTMGSGN